MEDNEDELENKLVLEDCYAASLCLSYALLLYDAAHKVSSHVHTCHSNTSRVQSNIRDCLHLISLLLLY